MPCVYSPELSKILERQVKRELTLRELILIEAPQVFVDKQRKSVQENLKYLEEYSVPVEIKNQFYLAWLQMREKQLRLSLPKPQCEICSYLVEASMSDSITPDDLDCPKHPGRPEEIAKRDIALCEHYDPKYGDPEKIKESIRKKISAIEQFIAELE